MTATEEPRLRGDSPVDPKDDTRGPKVRAMFAGIARKYDLLNKIITGGRDQSWRKRTVRMAGITGNETVLDVCCGTGDLALQFARAKIKPARVLASDFTPEMLRIAAQKAGKLNVEVPWFAADALNLPLPNASVDVVSVGWGVRNLQDIDAGLREFARILKPGGRLVILEATPPKGPTGRLASWYINRVIPRVGNLLTGSRDKAYSYLADSIHLFPDAQELKLRMESAGFADVRFRKMSLGAMAIHVGFRPN